MDDRSPSAGADLATSVARVYEHLEPARRARLLSVMLPAVGPLALAALGSGVLSKFLTRSRWHEVNVSLDDAAQVSAGTIQALTRYIEQSDMSVIQKACTLLAEQSLSTPALTVAVVALAMHVIRQHASRPR